MALLRTILRGTVAAFIWLHALFLVSFSPPSLGWLSAALGLHTGETAVLIVLVGLSCLSAYGWLSFAYDVGYIYLFPFIALYTLAGAVVAAFSESTPIAATLDVKQQSATKTFRSGLSVVTRPLATALTGFTLVWGAVIVTTSSYWILRVSLTVLVLHVLKALYRWGAFVVAAHSQLTVVDSIVKAQARKLIAVVVSADDASEEATVREAVNSLAAMVGLVDLLNRSTALKITVAASVVIFSVTHIYFALLFSFLYTGLAHVQGFVYSWSEALTTAIFILPFAGNLPPIPSVRIAGGIQWVLVAIAGLGTMVGFLQRRFDTVYSVLEEVQASVSASEIKEKFETMRERFKQSTPKRSSRERTQ